MIKKITLEGFSDIGGAKKLKYFKKTKNNQQSLTSTHERTDRESPIGKWLNSYLKGQSELDDRVVHLLFSANRWECVYVSQTFNSRDIGIIL